MFYLLQDSAILQDCSIGPMESHVPYIIGIHVAPPFNTLINVSDCIVQCEYRTRIPETTASLHGHGCVVEHCMGSSATVYHQHRRANYFKEQIRAKGNSAPPPHSLLTA